MRELKLEVKMFPDSFREKLDELKFVIRATDNSDSGRPDGTAIKKAFELIPTRYFDAPDNFLAFRSEIEITPTAYVTTINVWRCRRDLTIDDFKLAVETISERCRFAIGVHSLHH